MIEEDNVFFDLCPYYYLSEPTTTEGSSPANRATEVSLLFIMKKAALTYHTFFENSIIACLVRRRMSTPLPITIVRVMSRLW